VCASLRLSIFAPHQKAHKAHTFITAPTSQLKKAKIAFAFRLCTALFALLTALVWIVIQPKKRLQHHALIIISDLGYWFFYIF
jgi:hypothetical protein